MSRLGSALVYGIATVFVLAALVSFIFSLLLKWTDIHESSLTWIVFAASVVSLFIGGVVAGGKSQEKGWLAGGLTGLSFTAIVFLFQFLGIEKPFTIEQWLYHLGFLIAASLGGIVGVNLSPVRRERA